MDLLLILCFFCFLVPAFNTYDKPINWTIALALIAIPTVSTLLLIAGELEFRRFAKLYIFVLIMWAVYLNALWRQRATLWPSKYGSE